MKPLNAPEDVSDVEQIALGETDEPIIVPGSLRAEIVDDLFDTCRSDHDYLRTVLMEAVANWKAETVNAYARDYLPARDSEGRGAAE